MFVLRLLLIALVAASTNALLVCTRPTMALSTALRPRMQEAPPPPPKGKLGATVDQDGKSNVWVRAPRPRSPLVTSGAPFSRRSSPAHARIRPSLQAVEPSMKVEKEDKGLLAFAPVALVAVGAVLAVPLLPLLFAANPDQV